MPFISDKFAMVFKLFFSIFFILSFVLKSYSANLILNDESNHYSLKRNLYVYDKSKNSLSIHELIKNTIKEEAIKLSNFKVIKNDEYHWFMLIVKNNFKNEDNKFLILNRENNKIIPVFYKGKSKWIENSTKPFSISKKEKSYFYLKLKPSLINFKKLIIFNNKELSRIRFFEKYLSMFVLNLLAFLLIFNVFVFFNIKNKKNIGFLIGYIYFLILYFVFSKNFLIDFSRYQNSKSIEYLHLISLSFNMIFQFFISLNYFKINKETSNLKIILSIPLILIVTSIISITFKYNSVGVHFLIYTLMNLFLIIFGVLRFNFSHNSFKMFFFAIAFLLIGSVINLLNLFDLLKSFFFYDFVIYIFQLLGSFLFTFSLLLEIKKSTNSESNKKLTLIESKLEKEKNDNNVLITQLEKEKDKMSSLKDELFDKKSETDAILEISGKAFLTIDCYGKICQPISNRCIEILGREVEGEKPSNILFPNLKPGMKEFEELKNNLIKVFGAKRDFFNALQIRFPRKSLILTGTESKKLIIKITYEPIMDKHDNVLKILCLIEDKTTESDEFYTIKSESLRYSFLSDIFNMSDEMRKDIAKKLELPIKHLYELLNYLSNSSIEGEKPTIVTRTVRYLLDHFTKDFSTESLEKNIDLYKNDINIQIEFFEKFGAENGYVSISSVVGVYDLVVNLLADTLQFCEELERFNIGFKIDEDIEQEVEDTLEILSSQFSNLMEYTFLIRNQEINKITNNDLKKAVVNAKNISKKNFETNIPLIYQKAKKLSLLYFVQGEHFKFSVFEDFAESVKLLPKVDVLTASDLRYNLLDPYLETLKLKDDFL